MQFEYPVGDGFSKSETTRRRSNQCFHGLYPSLTQYSRMDLLCHREKAFTSVVGGYCRISLFQDRIEDSKVTFSCRGIL